MHQCIRPSLLDEMALLISCGRGLRVDKAIVRQLRDSMHALFEASPEPLARVAIVTALYGGLGRSGRVLSDAHDAFVSMARETRRRHVRPGDRPQGAVQRRRDDHVPCQAIFLERDVQDHVRSQGLPLVISGRAISGRRDTSGSRLYPRYFKKRMLNTRSSENTTNVIHKNP